MTQIDELVIYTDGACRGNPGEGGAGVVFEDGEGKEVTTIQRYLGLVTNNVAEYRALLIALEVAQEFNAKRIRLFLDSELVVKQIKGEYRVKNSNIKPLYEVVKAAISAFEEVQITHIPRDKNKRADLLANAAIDEHIG
jgi:ribonuclease HI